MRKFPVLPVTLILILLAVAAFVLFPRTGGQFMAESAVDAPQSAMPVPEDAPEVEGEAAIPAPMGNVDEALSAAPTPDASIMPTAPEPVTQQDRHRLGEDRWVLSWLGEEVVPKGDRAPNIVFEMEEGRANGYAGCNRYSSPFDLDDDSLSFGLIVATQMACDQLALEVAYLQKLESVVGWRLDDGVLSLTDGTGADVVRFVRP